MSKAVIRVSFKKAIQKIFRKFTRKHLCWSLTDYRSQYEITETPAQVFSCEFCKILRTLIFVEHIGTVASEMLHD